MEKDLTKTYRSFLKDGVRKRVDFWKTDQNRGLPPPPVEKPFPERATLVGLPKPGAWKGVGNIDLSRAIAGRQSRRLYRKDPLTLDELSFLLWATQGIRQVLDAGHAYRTVPSAGCRHAFETYLCVLDVAGLEPAFYRYLPLEHQLLLEFREENAGQKLVEALYGQPYPRRAAVTFIWTVIPYRMEWRYGAASYKVLALDAGHVCQNLYLACEAIGAGTCAVAAYDQQAMAHILKVDGKDEFTIYLASVGKRRS